MRKRICYIGSFLLAIIGIIHICSTRQFFEYTNENDIVGIVGYITDSTQVIQKFKAQKNYIDSISIMFYKEPECEEGRIKVELADEEDTVIAENVIEYSDLKNIQYSNIDLGLVLQKGKIYKIVISKVDGTGDVSVYIKNCNSVSAGVLMGGNELNYELTIKYVYGTYEYGKIILWIILVCMFCVLICRDIAIPEKIAGKIVIFFVIISPLAVFIFIETITNNLKNIIFGAIFLTYILLLSLCIFLALVLKNKGKGVVFFNIIISVPGLINYYVYTYRGTPFLPWDIFSVKTALAVIQGYEFSLSINAMFILSIYIMYNIFIIKIDKVKMTVPKKGVLLSAVAMCIVCFLIGQGTLIREWFKITDDFLITEAYRNNGFWINFVMNTKYLAVTKPAQYNEAKTLQLLESYERSDHSGEYDEIPNIIVIMNESFTDISKLGVLETNMEVLPYMNALQDNVIKGNVYVSVFGGNTANTEFEFLTNCSMAFMPIGSIPYSKYIREKTDSLCYTLKRQGYTTIAIHPAGGSNWNRDAVYDNLGFDKFIRLEDFFDLDRVRNNVSDKCTYDKIISLVENNVDETPLFIFDVTIQNHGGYAENEDYVNTIKIFNLSDEYYSEEQYLSLIHESDKALGDLIEYFKSYDKPTLILFFGDHWPALSKTFYGDVANKEYDDFEEKELQELYSVPFICWANYDIEEKSIENISMNYLNNLIFEYTGLNGGRINNYLYELYSEVPVININGFKDNEGNWYGMSDKEMQKRTLEYQWMQYNIIFGKSN